jgi:ribosomal protein L11 methyltransferase
VFEVQVSAVPGLAARLWEDGECLYVGESDGRIVVGLADRTTADTIARRVGGTVVDLDADGRDDLDTWRAWARPTRVGRLLVRPAWLPPGPERDAVVVAYEEDRSTARRAAVEIAIDPGHAFGHGGHPSTALVLAALVARLRGGESVLDVGCGSGVLSVAAAALGAASATALDIDPGALAVTRDNAARNGLSQRIDVESTALSALRRRFDVVVANIGVVVLRDLAPTLLERVGPGGWLALSGLLERQGAEIVELTLDHARRSGLTMRLDDLRRLDGWAAPVLVRDEDPASRMASEPPPA